MWGWTHFAPVVVTVNMPYCFLVVTSQAIRETARPRGGEAAAAIQFWCFQMRDMAPGKTAEEMITPISR